MAAAVLFSLSAVAIILTPLAAKVLLPREMADLTIPFGRVLGFAAVMLVAPMLVGIALRHKAPKLAGKVAKPMNLLLTVSFVASVIVAASIKKEAMGEIGGAGVAAVAILLGTGMLSGWFLGGPDVASRCVLTSATGIRNAPLCMVIALASFPDSGVGAVVLTFAMLMVPPNLAFTVYHAVKAKRAAAAEASS